jgi:hypothetical protein
VTTAVLLYSYGAPSLHLETNVVSKGLRQLGFDEDEIQTSLGRLSDQQLHKIALKFVMIFANDLASRLPDLIKMQRTRSLCKEQGSETGAV